MDRTHGHSPARISAAVYTHAWSRRFRILRDSSRTREEIVQRIFRIYAALQSRATPFNVVLR